MPLARRDRVELACLVSRHDDWVALNGADRNCLDQAHDPWITGEICSYINVMIRQKKAAEARIAAHAVVSAVKSRLPTMPGIGPTIAAILIARLPELGSLARRKIAHALYLTAFVASRREPTLKTWRAKLVAAGNPRQSRPHRHCQKNAYHPCRRGAG